MFEPENFLPPLAKPVEIPAESPTSSRGTSTELITMTNVHGMRWNPLEEIFALGIITDGVWLAGGSLQTMIHPKLPINDFDIFFRSPSLVEGVKDKLVDAGYNEVFACPKGELFTYKMGEDAHPIQLITKFYYRDMQTIINSFDFTATMWATDGISIVTTPRAMKDTRAMRVRIHKVTFPVATLNRMMKYRHKKKFILDGDAMIDYVQQIADREFNEEEMALYVD